MKNSDIKPNSENTIKKSFVEPIVKRDTEPKPVPKRPEPPKPRGSFDFGAVKRGKTPGAYKPFGK